MCADGDEPDPNSRRNVEATLLRCPDHGVPVIVLGVKVVDGASPRYLLLCPEEACHRGLRILARSASEVTLLAIDGKALMEGK